MRDLSHSVPSARSSGPIESTQIRCRPMRLSSVIGRDPIGLRRREGRSFSWPGGVAGNRSRTASFCSVINVAVCSLTGRRRRSRWALELS